jgi:hypothetical protein
VEVERVVICHAHCNKAKFTLVKLEQEGSQVLGSGNARNRTCSRVPVRFNKIVTIF